MEDKENKGKDANKGKHEEKKGDSKKEKDLIKEDELVILNLQSLIVSNQLNSILEWRRPTIEGETWFVSLKAERSWSGSAGPCFEDDPRRGGGSDFLDDLSPEAPEVYEFELQRSEGFLRDLTKFGIQGTSSLISLWFVI